MTWRLFTVLEAILMIQVLRTTVVQLRLLPGAY